MLSVVEQLLPSVPCTVVGELHGQVVGTSMYVPWTKHLMYGGQVHIKKGYRYIFKNTFLLPEVTGIISIFVILGLLERFLKF